MKQKLAVNDIYIDRILMDWRYRVKKDGTLWTRISLNGKGLMSNGKWRKCGKTNCYGYSVFSPRFNGKKRDIKIHRLVYAAFKGPLDQTKVVNHKDADRLNNTPINLELVSWDYNIKYRGGK
jgi:stress-induced morphogen